MEVTAIYGNVPQKDTHACNNCPKSYRQKRNLIRHQRYECGKEPKFICPYCQLRSKHKSNLLNHIKNSHKINMSKM